MASLKNLEVIVVGAGIGGLSSAITLAQRGAKVQNFELSPDLKRQGDVIMIGSNATRQIKKWGGCLLEQIQKTAAQPEFMKIKDKSGRLLLNQPLPKEYGGDPNLYTNRTLMQNLFYEHAISLGVEFVFNTRVIDYFENDTSAGIIIDGVKHTADLVIIADGVHSKGRSIITGSSDKALKSGFAVYRSWFSLDELRDDPLTQWIAESDKDQFAIWIAEDTHAILTTNVKARSCTCFATHKDTSDIAESWHLKGDVEEMLEVVKGWDPALLAIIKSIPADALIDHKLLWRNPNKKWVSDKGRITVVGDAAHPHLATSGNGAAQAIEDAATIAALLEKLGKSQLSRALRAYEGLRYERTSLTQRMGWETRHRWHQTNWAAVAANPEFLKLPQPSWLNGHDAETYALEKSDEILEHLEKGAPFKSSNVPDDHIHVSWSIEDMMSREGQKVEASFYQVQN